MEQIRLAVALLVATSALMLTSVPSANGICCQNDGNFGCCAVKPCNIFCCNCDSGCRSSTFCRFPLDIPSDNATLLTSDHDATWRSFKRIDLNNDNVIDSNEAVAYLENIYAKQALHGQSVMSEDEIAKYVTRLNFLDQNQDGVIQPKEFDRNLA